MLARSSPRLALLAAALTAVLALWALVPGSDAPASRFSDAATTCLARAGTTVRVTVDIGGSDRSALVHLPRVRRGRLALVLALHGASGDGAFMERYSGLSRVADRRGFAVAYPDAAGPRWRIAAADGSADVTYLDALVDWLLAAGCFDAQRVSVVGVSNGGGMAARYACDGAHRLAGLVSVAGGYGTLPDCRPHHPLSVLEIHGTADAVVPYHGSPQQPRGDVPAWVGAWVVRDACPAAPRGTRVSRQVLRLDWGPCRAGTAVAHLRLRGGTHAWPGADPPDPGPRLGVSAADETWAFLRGRRAVAALAAERDGG